jgi:hypothetical protein
MNLAGMRIGRLCIAFLACLWLSGCCDDWVKLIVLAGHRSEADCRKFAEGLAIPDATFVCPGEEVTICWTSNVSSVQVDPGLGTFGGTGITYLTVAGDVTIKATPVGSCAGAREMKVDVVTADTPSTWVAHWLSDCSKIVFEISDAFVSTKINARDITATWEPTVTVGETTYACATPPFLGGFHKEEVYGFELLKPYLTFAFTRLLRAVGHWEFVFKGDCGKDWRCNPYASLPFDVTLTCERK